MGWLSDACMLCMRYTYYWVRCDDRSSAIVTSYAPAPPLHMLRPTGTVTHCHLGLLFRCAWHGFLALQLSPCKLHHLHSQQAMCDGLTILLTLSTHLDSARFSWFIASGFKICYTCFVPDTLCHVNGYLPTSTWALTVDMVASLDVILLAIPGV